MKRVAAWAAFLWHYEPVALAALPTVLVTAGLTATEAHNVTQAVSGALAAAAQVVLALAARRKVRPTKGSKS